MRGITAERPTAQAKATLEDSQGLPLRRLVRLIVPSNFVDLFSDQRADRHTSASSGHASPLESLQRQANRQVLSRGQVVDMQLAGIYVQLEPVRETTLDEYAASPKTGFPRIQGQLVSRGSSRLDEGLNATCPSGRPGEPSGVTLDKATGRTPERA
jgi:hypothetical protein